MKLHTADNYLSVSLKWKLTESQLTLITILLRILIGATICSAGVLKVINQESFQRSLSTYGFFSEDMINFIAGTLPQVEAIIGMLFLFGIYTRKLGVIIAFMLILFSLVAGLADASGRLVDCGCLPLNEQAGPIGIGFYLRNALLILATLWIVLKTRPESD